MIKKIGKEILKRQYKKNKIECDTEGIVNLLKSGLFEIKGFVIDDGKTDQDLEFHTLRFYFKKK